MKIVKLSLQDFAIPAPLRGSIEPGSGLKDSHHKGAELHRLIQKQRAEEIPGYESEKVISWTFEKGDYQFQVSGRMDGFIPGDHPMIEEIKSSFNVFELSKNLKDKRYDHPYYLQLLSYGYFYYQKHGKKPELSFHLVSSRREESYDFNIYLDLKEYGEWLKKRLSELVVHAKKSEKRLERRKKLSSLMAFPFSKPRSGQIELMQFIEKGIGEGKRMMIQAPTGLGKTIGVLYPALMDSLKRGQRLIYITPKNSQQSVAEEALEKLSTKGCSTKSLSITAKSKMCLKAEPLCNPDYCEFAKDYYDKLITHDIRNELSKKKKLTPKIMKNLAEKYQVCPFELQLEAIEEADTIICDYNYIFGNQNALGRFKAIGLEQTGKPNLVIDEAHNLPARTMGQFSPVLSSHFIENLRQEMKQLPKKFSREGVALIDLCLQTIKDVTPDKKETRSLNIQGEEFLNVNEELKAFLSQYLESDVEIKAKDVVLRLVFYWGEFSETLSTLDPTQEEFFVTGQNDGQNRTIKITCCDASSLIKERYENFENVVAFSATLKPFAYYAQLSGLSGDNLIKEEFLSPFKKENRKVLIIPQISTRYSMREKSYPKIADAIEKIISVKKGNYLVFFPSFDFLEKTSSLFIAPNGFSLIKQKRFMRNDDVENILKGLREQRRPTVMFAVQGGIFSEGIDYLGDMVIGAFVIGPPLPIFDFERERMKDYYQNSYQSGFNYAYTYPAMAKAVQAAGRVIRSENDKGIIVLMDDRFLDKSYGDVLPQDWFVDGPRELVSQSILADLFHFWNS